jgi:peroxiredoxin
MWHEAAIAMDSATRVELSYMNNRLALPYETWNYAHNRDYLCYIQEQLGRANESIQGAKDLIAAPMDPEVNPADAYWTQFPLLRALVKFERWSEILDGKTLKPVKEPLGELMRSGAEVLALVKMDRRFEAREKLRTLQATIEQMKNDKNPQTALPPDFPMPSIVQVAEAWLRLAEGDRLGGLTILMAAAEEERKAREEGKYANDPPFDPWPIMRLVGDTFAGSGDHRAAVEAFAKALEQEPNDAWCLAGLAKSWNAMGDKSKAREFAGQLMAVWSGADKGLRPMQDVLALNLDVKPTPKTPRPERTYVPSQLAHLGPSNWMPFAAPKLTVTNVNGKPVKLEDFRGKNVLLVFYLTDTCVHCVEQLGMINTKAEEFEAADTVLLAVSSDSPEKNKANQLASFKLTLLSDKNHENARRFASYDDFEDMELHSTILIDREGRVRWKRTGGDPFTKIDYLLAEINRWGGKAPEAVK